MGTAGEPFSILAVGAQGIRNTITDEIRATVVDHVVNHGMSMREAGQRVQPNLSR